MTLFFGPGADCVRESQCVDEVQKLEPPLQSLDRVSLDNGPIGHLGEQLTPFFVRDCGPSHLTRLTLAPR
jgi:hypothetical protein